MRFFSSTQLAECAAREVRWRKRVYPNRIATGRMSQAKADSEIAMMALIQEHFEAMAKTDQPELQLDEPRRCDTNLVGAAGECLACNAEQGESCRDGK